MINLNFGKVTALVAAFLISLTSTSEAFASQPLFDIQGDWDSKFGALNIKMEGLDNNGNAIISGYYQAGNSKAPIVWGRVFRQNNLNIARIEYYMNWKPLYGYAEFILDPIKGSFEGTYYQGGQSGKWTLTRRLGPKLKIRSDLSRIQPKTERGNRLKTVTGKWDSNFGVVNLVGTSLAVSKQVKGTFKRSDGKVGEITSGSFMKTAQGGKLRIKYFCPWNNVRGEATFQPDRKVGGRMLLGVYKQGNRSGSWNLCRPAKNM